MSGVASCFGNTEAGLDLLHCDDESAAGKRASSVMKGGGRYSGQQPDMELPRFSGRFISCDSVGCKGDIAGGLLEVHWREISEC